MRESYEHCEVVVILGMLMLIRLVESPVFAFRVFE